ncbi:MAG: ATP-binding protein [Cellulosilyticaceae bacterium]
MSNNNIFKKDKINQLSYREQAREKLPTYFGSRDNYYHGVSELLNNSTDEVLNNFTRGVVEVELDETCEIITISDTGRGIPIDDEESVELLFEILFASGKYDASENSTSGVNGVGATTLNYTSDIFICESHMNGECYKVSYSEGGQNRKYERLGKTDKHGTTITFKLDKTMYTETKYCPIEIENKVRRTSLVSENITFIYKHMSEVKEFNNTIEDYFEKYSSDIIGNELQYNPKQYERMTGIERNGKKQDVKETAKIDLIFGTCVGENLLQETMLNGNYLKDRGSIFDGIVEGFRTTINKYCKDNKLFKKGEKQNIVAQDIESGISFVARVLSNIVEYEGQTKFSTKKEYYKEVAKEYVIENLEITKMENKKEFERMIQQILICKRANENNEKAKQVLKKKLTEKVDGINGIVEGFVDCDVEKGGEIFFSEGKSALGAIILARDSSFQAGYPFRGKMINPFKNKLSKVLANDEVQDMIRLLECGVEIESKLTKDLPKFDINNMRWSKIILTADADSDGKQINVLGLANIFKLCPSLITEGYVYIALPPLFEIKVSDSEKYYALTTSEREDILKNKVKGRKCEIHRLKG